MYMYAIILCGCICFWQEPVERKLGRRVITSTKNSRPLYKTIWDYVYDIPLIQSLQQLLSDSMILGEVHIHCISFCLVHVHVLCISHNYVHVYKLCCFFNTCTCSNVVCTCRYFVNINVKMNWYQITATELFTSHTLCFLQLLHRWKYLLTMMTLRSVIPLVLEQRSIS